MEEEVVLQQEQEDELFEIPQELEARYKTLLAAMQADWAGGAVKEIKCRVCLDARLKTWDGFKHHCETAETHPFKIYSCDNCSVYFARKDSLKRHREHPPAMCLGATAEQADVKRRVTQNTHDGLVAILNSGEGIAMPFSQTMKNMFPKSIKKWKRGSRGQN